MSEYGSRRTPSDRNYRSSSSARPSGSRPAGARPSGSRPSGTRPAGARPSGSRPSGTRPSGSRPNGSRPSQGRRVPPRRRRRRTSTRFYIFAAIAAIIVVVLLIVLLGRGGSNGGSQPQATPTVAPNVGGAENATVGVNETPQTSGDENFTGGGDESVGVITDDTTQEELAAMLANSDTSVVGLAAEDQVQIDKLNINTTLPDTWLNILLLGTDERNPNEPARSDTMMICSVNKETGQIKLTSIMRDTAYKYTNMPKYNGTYGINCANYFGGPKYAISIVNECLDMNIQYYASINFFGFQQIATQLGGIDVDISEAEMNEINKKQYEQARIARDHGFDEGEGIENETLTTFGANTHLNGRQTVAYARVRKTDSDYTRAERQQTVIRKLTAKLRQKNIIELTNLAMTFMQYVNTNLDLQTITDIGMKVLEGGKTTIDTFRVPVNGTYKEERRNENALLYDTDWETNKRQLKEFIYYN